MLRTVGDVAMLYEKMLEERKSPMEVMKSQETGIPENLKLDERTFEVYQLTESQLRLKLHVRNRKGSFKFLEKRRKLYQDAWNAVPIPPKEVGLPKE